MILTVGDMAPDFSLCNENGQPIKLSSLWGKKIVLYFYPKDMTPGCTLEAENFRDKIELFDTKNTLIIGVSKDDEIRHKKFKERYRLPFLLVADVDGAVCKSYGVWIEKNTFGKKYMGINRTTFLIAEGGQISKIWRRVKVKGHADEVLDSVAF